MKEAEYPIVDDYRRLSFLEENHDFNYSLKGTTFRINLTVLEYFTNGYFGNYDLPKPIKIGSVMWISGRKHGSLEIPFDFVFDNCSSELQSQMIYHLDLLTLEYTGI